jgi:predicted dehydrogenase
MIRFGIVGTSKITQEFGKAVAIASAEIGVTIQAVYSRSKETGQAYAAQHNIPRAFDNFADMLAWDDIDAVYIASPNSLHAEHAIQAMRAGKHVLVEKPFAANAAQAAQMIEVAHQQGVLLMEAMKSTVQPGMQAVRVQLPRLGTIRKYFASYCQYSSRYDAFKQGDIQNAFKSELANGALMDIGTYTLHPLIYLFGKPIKIHAEATMLHTGVDGSGSLLMNYEQGMEAAVLYSKITDSHLPSEIQGEAGTLLIDRINEPRELTFIDRQGNKEKIPVFQTEHSMVDEVAHFADLIERGKTQSPINSHAQSLAVMQVMDEARKQIGLRYSADFV